MDSAFYSYLQIRPLKTSDSFDISLLRAFLEEQNELQRESNHFYKNKEGGPFLSVFLAFVNNYDSWSSSNTNETMTNFISITSSKVNDKVPAASIASCIKIARFMHWELLEETDDTYHLIWSPGN